MAEEWQSRTAQGFKTFADPVEDTVPAWIKRLKAKTNGSDKTDTSTQPPSEEVSTYSYACYTLRESLRDREATTEDFNAFLSTATPQALPEESLLRLRAIFLVDASSSTLQPGQKIHVEGEVLRGASKIMLMALMALHLVKKIVVVKILEKANLKAFGAAAGKRIRGGERLPEGDPEWLKKNLAEYRAYAAQGKGSFAEKMIEKRPGILKAAKAELDEEPCYKLMWHFASVEILDDEALSRVLIDYREKDQLAFGSNTSGNDDKVARMTALAKHILTLDVITLEDVFGPSTKCIKEAIESAALARVLVEHSEDDLNDICMMHGGIEGVLKINESPFVSKTPEDSLHPVGHKDNPEQIVLDLARYGMAVRKAADSVSQGVFMKMW